MYYQCQLQFGYTILQNLFIAEHLAPSKCFNGNYKNFDMRKIDPCMEMNITDNYLTIELRMIVDEGDNYFLISLAVKNTRIFHQS